MPKSILIVLFIFFSINILNAQVEDTSGIEKLIQDTEEEINTLDMKYRQLENRLRESQKEIAIRFGILDKTDSLQLLAYKDLFSENISLKREIEDTRDSLNNGIRVLEQELYEARKGNASLLIILFSLIVLSFIYLFYRNYRVEVQVNERLLKVTMETELKIQKLKNTFRKKLVTLTETFDKNVKKRIKKSDKSFNKKLRNIKK